MWRQKEMNEKRKEGGRTGKRKWGKWRIVSTIFGVPIALYMGYSALISVNDKDNDEFIFTEMDKHVVNNCRDELIYLAYREGDMRSINLLEEVLTSYLDRDPSGKLNKRDLLEDMKTYLHQNNSEKLDELRRNFKNRDWDARKQIYDELKVRCMDFILKEMRTQSDMN